MQKQYFIYTMMDLIEDKSTLDQIIACWFNTDPKDAICNQHIIASKN